MARESAGEFTRPSEEVPRHVAVIMDGNGRWARRRGLQRPSGHSAGAESVRAVVRECARSGVEQLTLFAFSTENWRRPRREVAFLMSLLKKFLVDEREELMENNMRVRAIGHTKALPAGVRKELAKTLEMSRNNTGMIVRLALNYGGRQAMVDAVRRLAIQAKDRRIEPAEITEADVEACLHDGEMTDPDLLIRTGGEQRLSNFLLWELSYAELWFTRTCWPDFRAGHLREAFRAYARRERRYGGLVSRGRTPQRRAPAAPR